MLALVFCVVVLDLDLFGLEAVLVKCLGKLVHVELHVAEVARVLVFLGRELLFKSLVVGDGTPELGLKVFALDLGVVAIDLDLVCLEAVLVKGLGKLVHVELHVVEAARVLVFLGSHRIEVV